MPTRWCGALSCDLASACWTWPRGRGTVALKAAALVGAQGRVVATDLTPEWAEVVAERAAEAGLRNVAFRAMGAETLDLSDNSFDVAYCQFGLMFVPDPVQALPRDVCACSCRVGGGRGLEHGGKGAPLLLCQSLPGARPAAPVAPEQQIPSAVSLGEPGLIEGHAAAVGFGEMRVERHVLDFVADLPEAMWQQRVENGQPEIRGGGTPLRRRMRALARAVCGRAATVRARRPGAPAQ